MSKHLNPFFIMWRKLREESVFDTRIMSLFRQDFEQHRDEEGRELDLDKRRNYSYYTLKSPDWCNIVPITDKGEVVCVRQYRVGTDEVTLEVPGGVIDPTDKDRIEGAIRELEEETGYAPAKGARIEILGATTSNPAIFNNKVHHLLVGPVSKTRIQNCDPGECIEVELVPIPEFLAKIASGEINHALMLPGLLQFLLKDAHGSELMSQILGKYSTVSSK